MPLLDLDRQSITAARRQFADARDAQRQARAALKQAQNELAAARRSGAGERELARLQARIGKLAGQAREQIDGTRAQLRGIVGLSEQLRAQRDPAVMVQALDTRHPVLLMPVAIQTRYDDATTRLMIRIYPDPLHAFQHEPGLTDKEIASAQRYWTQRFANPEDSTSPWQEISIPYGPMRAAYLVRTLTPTNVGQIGNRRRARLRSRLCAAGRARCTRGGGRGAARPLRRGRLQERCGGAAQVGGAGGRPAADVAAVRPAAGRDPAAWDPFAGDRAWLVDYPAAVAAGMGITVLAGDLKNGVTLADGLDRLVVLGVDWTQTPESAAALVGDLLDNHQHAEA